MADRSGYIGRAPGDSAVTVARQNFTPTGVQTNFTFASGYTPGYLDAYLNGVKLVVAQDFTATDGSVVGLTSAAASGDILELVAFKAFNAASVASAGGDFSVGGNQTIDGTLLVTGGTTLSNLNVSGISTLGTVSGLDLNGSVLTLDADGDTTITADTDDQIDIAFGGNDRLTLSTGLIDLKNDGSQSAIRLYCESSNAHYAALQAPAHSAFSGNITLTLPATTDTLVARTTTDTLTNKTLTSPTISTPTLTGGVGIADSIFHTGDTNTQLRFPAADTFTVETGGNERFRIESDGGTTASNNLTLDEDGRLLLGTTTEGNGGADQFTISTSEHTGMTLRSGTTHQGNIFFADGTSGDDEFRGIIRYDHNDNSMQLRTNATEALRITSAGNLGIGGLTNPGALLSIPAGESNTPRLAIESAVDDNDFTITQYEDGSGTYTMIGQNVKLNSSGNTTVLDSAHKTAGVLLDARSNGNLTFYTGGDNASAERLRIASAGQIGLGGANYGSSGQVITSNGSGSAPTWQDTGTPTIASQAEAEAGTNNTNMMTPLRVKQAIDELGGNVIQSIQRGTISINDTDSSGTATITSVTTSKAMLNHLGQSGQGNNARDGEIRITLTNATTVTANRQSANGSVSVNYQVVEFK